ncbi:XkdN [Clostridium botulinum]|uniref:Phage XkdN-like protein n=1 Tax=Clostridium botulinum TaxID=1491 RepID=A0ABD7CFY8_CLOBO|nr:XkdN [Clostridium botulinum]KGO14286.1 XkdN [Clostridium botulinum]QRI52260.1 hypothetical protein JQS73_12560 [Clostridium botulinum]
MSNVNEEKILNMKEEDILNQLLTGEEELPTATVILDRLKIKLELKGLSEKEISSIRKECSTRKKNKGNWVEKLNDNEFDAGLIVGATTNINWNDPKLLESKNVSDGKQYIRRKLLAGEITNLVNKILDLSGFNDEIEDVEDIKN